MKLFDYDGPLMRALVYLGELILLNLLFLLCCLPVITAGASAAAMYTVAFRNLDGKGGHVCRQFFTAFRAKQPVRQKRISRPQPALRRHRRQTLQHR